MCRRYQLLNWRHFSPTYWWTSLSVLCNCLFFFIPCCCYVFQGDFICCNMFVRTYCPSWPAMRIMQATIMPSERPWETIFNGPSHALPPLTKLCSAFLESLLEKRTASTGWFLSRILNCNRNFGTEITFDFLLRIRCLCNHLFTLLNEMKKHI